MLTYNKYDKSENSSQQCCKALLKTHRTLSLGSWTPDWTRACLGFGG